MAKYRLFRKTILGIFVLLVVATIGISGYVAHGLTHPARETVDSTPQALGLVFDDVTFQSQQDQTNLSGWWVPSSTSSDKTVVFVHGYTSSRLVKAAQVLPLVKKLADSGYNVLMFDLRGAGNSKGTVVTFGQKEQFDVLAAIDFAKTKKNSKHIALLGWSMGAATSILAGTESPDVQGIIADSPFADLHNYINTNLPIWSGLPRYPFTPLIFAMTSAMYGLNPGSVSPYKAITNLGDRGFLLIHSCKDTAIPCENSRQIYNALADKLHSELWLTERGDHVKSYSEYGPVYEEKIINFLAKYLH